MAVAVRHITAIVPDEAGYPATGPAFLRQPLDYVAGDSLTVNIALLDQAGAPRAIGGAALTVTISNAAGTAVVARICTIDNDSGGLAHADLNANDPLPPGAYTYDVTMATGGQYVHVVQRSAFNVAPSLYTIGGPVTSPAPTTIIGYGLPTQAGQGGKVLGTDGSALSWVAQTGGGSSLPSQTGNAGKALTTNGTAASWGSALGTPGSTGQVQFGAGAAALLSPDSLSAVLIQNSVATIVAGNNANQSGVSMTPTSLDIASPGPIRFNGISVAFGGGSAGKLLRHDGSGWGPADIAAGYVTNTMLANSSLTVGAGSGLTGGGAVSLGGSTSLAVDTTVVATLTGAQTLTNKTISGASNTFSAIPESAVTNLVSDLAARALTSTTISAGNGLQGGGDLSANRTIDLRLNASGGLSKVLGAGNELGIAAGGVSNAMLANNSLTVTAGAGLAGGGPVALGASVSLNIPAQAGVTPGSYTSSNITVDARGIITAIASGTGGVTSISAGTGLSASPSSPITSTGTLSIDQSFAPTWTGVHTHQFASVGTAQTPAISLVNPTAAAAGAQQFSPMLELIGQGWNSTASASQTVKIAMQAKPVQAAGVPTFQLSSYISRNGAAYSEWIRTETSNGTDWYQRTADGNNGIGAAAGNLYFYAGSGTPRALFTGASFTPWSTLGANVGSATVKFNEVWGQIYGGTVQTVAAAASLTINPTLGETVRITLSATVITSLTISAGKEGQTLIIEVIQDGTGSRTIPTTWTNVLFAGGSYTATTTASKRDVITFRYDSIDAKWVEMSRAMSL